MSWPIGVLSELADVTSGFAFKSTWFGEGTSKVIRIGDLQNGHVDIDKAQTFDSSAHLVKDSFKVKTGDILMALSGATVGKIAVVDDSSDGAYLNQRVAVIRAKKPESACYIKYVFSGSFLDKLLLEAGGAAQPNLSPKDLSNMEIPLPPLAEQKRIASILDKADAIRQKRQQAIKLADEFLRSVFLEMFGDPVTNPKGWEVKPLKDQIAHANNGISRRRKEQENEGDIVLRLQDVHYEGIHYTKELNRISLEDKEKEKYLLKIGDILFIRVNGNPDYVGRSSVFSGYKEPVYHNDHLIRIKCGKDYRPEFLSYLFNSKAGRRIISKNTKTSAGQHTISQSGIELLQFYRPPISLQNQFIGIRTIVMARLHSKYQKSSVNIESSFNALSQKAFSGQL